MHILGQTWLSCPNDGSERSERDFRSDAGSRAYASEGATTSHPSEPVVFFLLNGGKVAPEFARDRVPEHREKGRELSRNEVSPSSFETASDTKETVRDKEDCRLCLSDLTKEREDVVAVTTEIRFWDLD